MLAPLGPVSADALRFTLVKPLEGPCTITWVSTVSPRALDRAMEAVVPAAAVFATRTMPGDTHTGYAALAGCTPVPVTATIAGELVALLPTVTLPAIVPATAGTNATLKGAVCPGARTVPGETPIALSSVLEVPTLEIVTLELPEFVSVTLRVEVALVFTLPKLKLDGLALSR